MGENVGDAVVGLDDGLGVGDEVGIFVGIAVVGSSVSVELLFVAMADEFASSATLGKRTVALLLLSVPATVGLVVGAIKEGRAVGALLLSSCPALSSSSYLNAVSSFVGSSVPVVGTSVGVEVGVDVGTDVGSSVGSGVGSSVDTGVGSSVGTSTGEVGEGVGSSVSGIPVGKSEGSRVSSPVSLC